MKVKNLKAGDRFVFSQDDRWVKTALLPPLGPRPAHRQSLLDLTQVVVQLDDGYVDVFSLEPEAEVLDR